jgi:hypothetical protein
MQLVEVAYCESLSQPMSSMEVKGELSDFSTAVESKNVPLFTSLGSEKSRRLDVISRTCKENYSLRVRPRITY